jgi:hypothetical protein
VALNSTRGALLPSNVRARLTGLLAILDRNGVQRTDFPCGRADLALVPSKFLSVTAGRHEVLMHCSGEMILPIRPKPNRIDPGGVTRIEPDRRIGDSVVRFGVAADYGYVHLPRNLESRYPDLARTFVEPENGSRLEPFYTVIAGIKSILENQGGHFMVNCGDILYPFGALHPKDRRLNAVLSAHNFVDTYLVPGNHEYGDARTPGDPYALLKAARDFGRIVMPALYYSHRVVFDGGAAKLIFLNSSTLLYDLEQQDFLREQLSEGRNEWRLVFLHHAPFSDGEHGDLPYYQQVLDQCGALKGPHRAHYVFSGHEHSLQALSYRPNSVFPKFVICGHRDPVHGDAYACKRKSDRLDFFTTQAGVQCVELSKEGITLRTLGLPSQDHPEGEVLFEQRSAWEPDLQPEHTGVRRAKV